ncbi:hypothetical protein J2X31_001338 [Flavobacterium arsenatis]|uniref:Uncharacterized protein n=1 Tax=Flavobacterium arsenatis TaxID=1484332 RepID=A0ABU1TN79_9FLAO|nr:hypothetical protein [Flavobacterium arsenatis]
MGWYSRLFQKKLPPSARRMVAELTEFELSESHKILLSTENVVEELLEHISEQQQLIKRYEAELEVLRSRNISDAEIQK